MNPQTPKIRSNDNVSLQGEIIRIPARKEMRPPCAHPSIDRMTRKTCSGGSSNGKEKRPRSRREKVSVPGFFIRAPKKEFRGSEFRVPAPNFLVPASKFLVRLLQKVNDTDKNLHRSPVLCKKIAQKSAIWAGSHKSRVTEIIQNGTICLFSQAFHDILIWWVSLCFWGFNPKWKNELKKLSDVEFLADEYPQSKPAGMNCPALQGDKPRRGGGELTLTGS